MRAAILETYGPPDALRLEERDLPSPASTEVLVRVHASPVTQGDRRIRAGDFPGIFALPGRLMMGWSGPRQQAQGSMFAGVVESVGEGATRFAVGDRVFGASMDSAHADYLVIDQTAAIARVPDGVDLADAAAVQFGAGTALPFLRDLGGVQPGQRVLIIGAAGGVGRYAVQVARHRGAHVTAVCRADQAELVRSLGADSVIDREQTDWRTAEETWDVIFDTSDRFRFADAHDRLTSQGRFLTLGLHSLSGVWDLLRTSFGAGRKACWTVVMDEQSTVQDVADLLHAGAIRAVIGPRFPLDRLVDAHRTLEARTHQGDVLVDVVPPALEEARRVG